VLWYCAHLYVPAYAGRWVRRWCLCRWAPQLAELARLPPILAVCPSDDLLSAYGRPILGMTHAQLYLKVAGCRTPGHQENCNFCSVNINVGPGPCEWFAVPASHWAQMDALCSRYVTSRTGERMRERERRLHGHERDARWHGVPWCA
jgi:hypothetical protein